MGFVNRVCGYLSSMEIFKTAAMPVGWKTPADIAEAFNSKYGKEWTTFLPETIRSVMKKTFNIKVDELLFNKIMATQLVCGDMYFNWDIFENVSLAFNNELPDFLLIQPLDMNEVVWGYICIKSLRPDYEPTVDVERYIRLVMDKDGLIWCPWFGYEIAPADKIKEVWRSADKHTDDESIGIQIDRLELIRDYIREMS